MESQARSVSSVLSPALLAIASNNLLLAGVFGRAHMAHSDLAVYELEQWTHVRQASYHNTHSGLNARPYTGDDLGI